jgi:short-subunit dehydrogenase involved in D-alanine esterification of teichoic acids
MKTTGLRILITGGGSGIGLALARRLAPDNIVVVAGRDEGKLARAIEDVPSLKAQRVDVTSEPQSRQAIQRIVKQLGGLDVVIQAAGVMQGYDLDDPQADELTAQEVDANLTGAIRIVRLALPALRQSGAPAIVLISSVVALAPAPGFAVYSATKAALHSLARSLRRDQGRDRIRVFEVLPTWVDSDLTQGFDVPKLSPEAVATAIVDGLAHDRQEILVGRAAAVALVNRISPRLAQTLVARASRPQSHEAVRTK